MYYNWSWKTFKFFYRRKSEFESIYNGITWYHDMKDNTLFQIWFDFPKWRFRFRIRNPFIWGFYPLIGVAKGLIYWDLENKIKEFKGEHWCETEDDKIEILNFASRYNIPQSNFTIKEGRF